MSRRARFSFRPQRGLWPLLSMLACAGEDASPSSERAQSNVYAELPSRPPAVAPEPGSSDPEPGPGSREGAVEGATPPSTADSSPPGSDPEGMPGDARVEREVIPPDGREDNEPGTTPPDGDVDTQPDGGTPDSEQPEPPAPGPVQAGGAGGTGGDGGTGGEGGTASEGGAAGTGGAGGSDPVNEEPPAGAAGGDGAAGTGPGDETPEEDEEADETDEEEEDAPPLRPSFHLAVIGSSTAAGEGASRPESGWVPLLATALAGVATVSVSNFAVAGYTSVELLPASRKSGNIEEAIGAQPDLIVVALAGSNDLSVGTSTATFFERLDTLRDTARIAGIPVFFASTAPKDIGTSERETLADWAARIRTSYASCWVPDLYGADSERAPCFIDIFTALASSSLGLLPQYSSGDGIHLNDVGHAEVYRQVDAMLRPYVCSVTLCR